jgi:hypothetical protein
MVADRVWAHECVTLRGYMQVTKCTSVCATNDSRYDISHCCVGTLVYADRSLFKRRICTSAYQSYKSSYPLGPNSLVEIIAA